MVQQKRNKVVDEDFEGGLTDDFPKDDDPIAPSSPSRPLTLCPMTGEVLGMLSVQPFFPVSMIWENLPYEDLF